MENEKNTFGGVAAMLTATLLWGLSYSAQRQGMEHLQPAVFNGIRTLIGMVCLLPVVLLQKSPRNSNGNLSLRTLLAGGISCGGALGAATLVQQCGVCYTSAGKAGFLTVLYIIFVPLFSLFLGKKCSKWLFMATLISLYGAYLLCFPPGDTMFSTLNTGDFLLLICAVFYSVHIMLVDHFAPATDFIQLSVIQLAVSGTLSILYALITGERFAASAIAEAGPQLLFTGIFSCSIAFTLQTMSQKNLHPALASLLMSLESIFALFGGILILHEKLSIREGVGCVFIFAAVLLTRFLPQPEEKTNKSEDRTHRGSGISDSAQ